MSHVYGHLSRHLPAFLNPQDAVVSVILGASQSVQEDGESALAQAHAIAGVIGATGEDLDFEASIYGIRRLTGETDAHLLSRIQLSAGPGVSPNGITSYLQSINQSAQFYEPAGGSFVAWNPRTNFRYDRETVAMTWARSTSAYGPTGTEYAANDPTWQPQGVMQWVGVFAGTSNLLLNSRFLSTSGTPVEPVSWTVTEASGGTIDVTTGTSPYSGNILSLSNTTSGASAGTVTQNAGTIAQSTYVFSAYANGPVTLSVVAENSSGTLDTPVSATNAATGDTLVYVAYTPASGFVDNCTVTISGQGSVYAVQLEEAADGAPTPIYINDSTTAGTVATRAADSFTMAAVDAVGTQGQGLMALAVDVGPYNAWSLSGHDAYLFDWSGSVAVWWDGTNLNALIGGVAISAAATFSEGPHLVALNWGQGSASLLMDGVVLATDAVSSPPTSVSGDVYIGTDHNGNNPINAFLGNLCFSEAQWMQTRAQALQAAVAIPVYAPTLCSAAWFTTTLAGIAGGMILGVANYVGVYLPPPGTSGFVLDQSFLDQTPMTNAQVTEQTTAQAVVFPLFAGGKKIFQFYPGSPT